jgi:ABC-2 type transport system ATP-binding protein
MLCSRVIIINKGRIEALDTPQNLRAHLGQAGHILFDAIVPDAQAAASALRALESVQSVSHRADGEWTVFTIHPAAGHDPRESLYRHAVDNKWRIREISRSPVSLEQVFAEVTGGEEI